MQKSSFIGFIIFVAIILCAIAFLSSSYFNIENTAVTGNTKIDSDTILKRAGLDKTENIFMFNIKKAEAAIAEDVYIDSVTISKDYMERTVTVNVAERILSGYVEYQSGTYLYVDDHGRVLDVSGSFADKLPVIVGLKFSAYTVGELLDTDNTEAFDIMVTLAQLINKYEMEQDVVKVDVTDPQDIHLYIRGIDVDLGAVADADEKIRTTQAILSTMDENVKGFLDITDVNKPAGFKVLS